MKTAREGGGAQGAQGRQLGIREGEGNDGMMEWWSDGVGGAQGRELGGRRAQRHRGTKAQRRGMMEWWLAGGEEVVGKDAKGGKARWSGFTPRSHETALPQSRRKAAPTVNTHYSGTCPRSRTSPLQPFFDQDQDHDHDQD